jgi:transposase
MIPNDRFQEFYPMPKDVIPLTAPRQVLAAGQIALLWQRAKDLGMTELLEDIFPGQARELLSAAIYMACEGNVMMNLDIFVKESLLSGKVSLNSQRSSELFAAISDEQRLSFFTKWIARHKKKEQALAYDVTSISSYGDLTKAEYGYNRDKENLPQLNIGLIHGSKTDLPLCYTLYSGSIVDKAFFPYMLELGDLLDINDLFYILDRGFLSQDNLSFAAENELNFLIAAPKSQKIYREALLAAASEIHHSRYYIPNTRCYGLKKTIAIDDRSYALYCYLNLSSAADEEAIIYQHLDKLAAELDKQMSPVSLSRYNKYYDVRRNDSPIAEYAINHEKVNEIISLAGMFCLLSNTADLTAQEALAIYGQRDMVEKAFQDLKNNIDNKRFLTQSDRTTEGKTFVAFLSLILWSDLARHGKGCNEKSIGRILKQLSTIKRVNYETGCSLLQALTKKQKDILTAFGIEPEQFVQDIIDF